jgi:CBS domain containing-hemolysin-like protein
MALCLILVLYLILKAGEIYLLTISKKESDQISKRKGLGSVHLYSLLSKSDFLFGALYQLSAFFVTTISVLTIILLKEAGLFVSLISASLLTFVFGHILPNILSVKYGLNLAYVTGGMIHFTKWLTSPVNSVLSSFAKSVEESKEERDVKSVEEFGEEKGMLLNIVKLSETTVNDIMTPRISVEGLEGGLSWSEVRTKAAESGFSRLPVYKDTIDNVTGFLYIKDLVGHIDNDESFDWTGHIRKAYFVPGVKKINDLLEEFRQKKMHLAVVADEYGGMEGIVTLEDILEEIVGEISDETDIKENNR